MHRRCKRLHAQTHNAQSAELKKDVPSLQKVLQDLSGTIYHVSSKVMNTQYQQVIFLYNRDKTHSPTSENSWSQSDTQRTFEGKTVLCGLYRNDTIIYHKLT